MIRASFTVTDRKGVSWDGNHLSISMRSLGSIGAISVLTFISSGQLVTMPASEVDNVKFHAAGAQHCGECGGSLWSLVGVADHANPKATVQ